MLKSLEYVRQCSKCIDKAATHLGGIIAYQAGVPTPMRELDWAQRAGREDAKPRPPLLEINTKFFKTATYGETLTITTHVEEWRAKVLVQVHRITRAGVDGDDLICEGREVRAFTRRDADNPDRLRAMPKPVIARINGHAHGAGFNLALACDFRVMAESATLNAGQW